MKAENIEKSDKNTERGQKPDRRERKKERKKGEKNKERPRETTHSECLLKINKIFEFNVPPGEIVHTGLNTEQGAHIWPLDL